MHMHICTRHFPAHYDDALRAIRLRIPVSHRINIVGAGEWKNLPPGRSAKTTSHVASRDDLLFTNVNLARFNFSTHVYLLAIGKKECACCRKKQFVSQCNVLHRKILRRSRSKACTIRIQVSCISFTYEAQTCDTNVFTTSALFFHASRERYGFYPKNVRTTRVS